jgi:hypothetical protein
MRGAVGTKKIRRVVRRKKKTGDSSVDFKNEANARGMTAAEYLDYLNRQNYRKKTGKNRRALDGLGENINPRVKRKKFKFLDEPKKRGSQF